MSDSIHSAFYRLLQKAEAVHQFTASSGGEVIRRLEKGRILHEDIVYYLSFCLCDQDVARRIELLASDKIVSLLDRYDCDASACPLLQYGFLPLRDQDGDIHGYSFRNNSVHLFYFGDVSEGVYCPSTELEVAASEDAFIRYSPCLGGISRFLKILADGDPYLDII